MMTQGLMGMPVRVLQRDGWYRIQTPDNYIAWVHRVGIHPVTKEELHVWNRAEKIVVTSHYGFVYSEPNQSSQTVSDVVAGNRLKWEGTKGAFYKVAYPDGRTGYISKSISMRTILFIHDIIIPRDASQQAYVGEHIDIAPDFSNLQPGDLIFFGRKATADRKERVVHVGMYIGNKRFIHSQGDVHVSSFDSADELFDEYNLGRLLFATRVLPYINKEASLNTTETNPYYK